MRACSTSSWLRAPGASSGSNCSEPRRSTTASTEAARAGSARAGARRWRRTRKARASAAVSASDALMRPAFAVIMIGAIVPVRALLRWTLLIGAVTYPVAIGGLVSALAFIGERWWPTTVALYLPGALFAAPLPLLTLALLVWGPRWL